MFETRKCRSWHFPSRLGSQCCNAPNAYVGDPFPSRIVCMYRRISYLAYSATVRSFIISKIQSFLPKRQCRRKGGRLRQYDDSVGRSKSERRDTEHSDGSLFMPSPSTRSISPDSTTFISCSGASASVAYELPMHMSFYSDTISLTFSLGIP